MNQLSVNTITVATPRPSQWRSGWHAFGPECASSRETKYRGGDTSHHAAGQQPIQYGPPSSHTTNATSRPTGKTISS